MTPGTARDLFEMGNALDDIQPVIEPVAAAILDHAKSLDHPRNVGELKYLCQGEKLRQAKGPTIL